MNNRNIILIAITICTLSIGAYWLNFGENNVSKNSSEWSNLGSYLSGTLGPILSFFSLIILIKSIDLQRLANKSLIEENNRQKALDEVKQFEMQFYNLLDAQQKSFDSLQLTAPNNEILKSSAAVTHLENIIIEAINEKRGKNILGICFHL